jgi:hypothetical protein
MHGGKLRNAYTVIVGNLKERYHIEDLGINKSIMLKMYFTKMGCEVVDGIHLAL